MGSMAPVGQCDVRRKRGGREHGQCCNNVREFHRAMISPKKIEKSQLQVPSLTGQSVNSSSLGKF